MAWLLVEIMGQQVVDRTKEETSNLDYTDRMNPFSVWLGTKLPKLFIA